MYYLLVLDQDFLDIHRCQTYRTFASLEEAEKYRDEAITTNILKFGFGGFAAWVRGDLSKESFSIKEITEEEKNFLRDTLGFSFGVGLPVEVE